MGRVRRTGQERQGRQEAMWCDGAAPDTAFWWAVLCCVPSAQGTAVGLPGETVPRGRDRIDSPSLVTWVQVHSQGGNTLLPWVSSGPWAATQETRSHVLGCGITSYSRSGEQLGMNVLSSEAVRLRASTWHLGNSRAWQRQQRYWWAMQDWAASSEVRWSWRESEEVFSVCVQYNRDLKEFFLLPDLVQSCFTEHFLKSVVIPLAHWFA